MKQATVSRHPGSNEQEIQDEPDWGQGHHNHHVGFLNRQHRYAGLTHDGDDHESMQSEEDRKFDQEALRKIRDFQNKKATGQLVNFKQVMKYQMDHARQEPKLYPPGSRFVVRAREDWVKKEQDWPANIKKREKEEKERRENEDEEKPSTNSKQDDSREGEGKEEGKSKDESKDAGEDEGKDEESKWRRKEGKETSKHHDAYGGSKDAEEGKPKSKYQKLREQYSPQEITLLNHLRHESEHIMSLTQNDGKQESPVKYIVEHRNTDIDAQDAMTPDNWIPRSGNLVRRTGQHPFNAEPRLDSLFAAGLITPNGLHYVRNHGAVPRLYWDEFKIDINHGDLILNMDDIAEKFESVNIPIAMACDGNRRGELNQIKKSKGFDWGSGAISCAYWKGPLLVDILQAAGITSEKYPLNGKRHWVNFAGADSPSEGTYETSIPLSYALDPANDVLLAYEMNNSPLPADHGYPLRLIIPGWVGGRCVKWLNSIWLSDCENKSYYHIWDNRVLPAFITEKDGEFAHTMFKHPSTTCNEQNLNSVIIHPGQSETLSIQDILAKDTYRIEGYAYEGGGHEIQRVEVSLDQGKTWLYCLRHFTPAPIRNGNRFWAWIHWHIDVDSAHFSRVESIQVRAFNVFKNTQPEHPVWNVLGMMNNGWYTVRASTTTDKKTGKASVIFRHPYHQQDDEGWMRPSTENQLAAAQQDSGTPSKQFTRAEIEKHNTKQEAWMVVNNNVYDVTSVLSWHPGGSATILANAGHLSLEVTSSFNSIHDEYAHKKLQECVIGRVTDKAVKYMTEQAKASAEEAAKEGESTQKMLLQTKKWVPVTLTKRDQISQDTFIYTFSYLSTSSSSSSSSSDKSPSKLGLGTCQHIQFGIHMLDKMLIRSYTPTRPIDISDDDGTFDLTIKTYYPDENQPGGAFSNFLLELPIGESVDVCGPTGEIEYLGRGTFDIEGSKQTYTKVNLVVGGSGLTPAYALIERVLRESFEKSENNQTNLQLRVIDANKSEDDILLHEKLDEAVKNSKGKIIITHVLSHPKDKEDWTTKQKGLEGHVNADIIRDKLFEPSKESITFLCGPPGLIQKAVLPALKDWGFKEGENVFGF